VASVTTAFLTRIGTLTKLSDYESECLSAMFDATVTVKAGEVLIETGRSYDKITFVEDGWATREKLLDDGRRQILNFALPGDSFGIYAPVANTADHDVRSTTDMRLYRVDSEQLLGIIAECPRLAAAIYWLASRDEAMLEEQVVRIGQRSAYERTAHILAELERRMTLVGKRADGNFTVPVTQDLLADALGLSAIHVNRTLKRLEREELVRLGRSSIEVLLPRELRRTAGFDGEYLEPSPFPLGTEGRLLEEIAKSN